MASAQIVNKKGKSLATQVGQFPSTGEHYSALLQKGSALTACVNAAITQLNANGTIAKLQKKWLSVYTSVPKIKP
jgi:polar amino acid transport system substrate-binding protein